MSGKSVHPLQAEMLDKWTLGNDSYEGEDAIKAGGTKYLPATSGQVIDGQGTKGQPGETAYQGYNMRAFYPDIFKDAVEAAIGIMHREKPKIQLPPQMEMMRENATGLNETLEMLLRKINAKQLTTGRLGLLGDIKVANSVVTPLIALYEDKAIRNWSEISDMGESLETDVVILDESDFKMNADFNWEFTNEYRVLALVDEQGNIDKNGEYASALLGEEDEISSANFIEPNVSGEKLGCIPFVFVNSKDLSPTPDMPPLHGLAKACLAIYRAEADYRQSLFMQGQDTLVRIGVVGHGDTDETVRTGAGSRIDVPQGGDAKYIGVSSNGLSEQRQSLENDYNRAYQKSGQLLDSTSKAKESGDALRIRVAAQTATLPQLAKTGAAALQRVLRCIAEWIGADPEKVVVEPNLNFSEADLNGRTLMEIVQSKGLGAPLSEESIHAWMKEQGFTKLSYEEELDKLSSEAPALPPVPSPVDEE